MVHQQAQECNFAEGSTPMYVPQRPRPGRLGNKPQAIQISVVRSEVQGTGQPDG